MQINEIYEAQPDGHYEIHPREHAIDQGHISADIDSPWVALWFDGDHEAPAVIAEGPNPSHAMLQLQDAMIESIVL